MTAHAQDTAYSLSTNQSAPVAASPSYNQGQLDQLVAPIALYPDPLLGQVLMASTYPLEVVEAARWLQNSTNASLTSDQLAATLAQQPWDPSVKALVAVPQVLNMMNANLQWTEQLGDAFLAQQADVMNSVQSLRQRAQATGALTTTSQQDVTDQGSDIAIEPENPDIVYVPVYNPNVVYGDWPYPSYAPYYFYPPGYIWGAGLIGFGAGIFVSNAIWGWDHWDWQHHRLNIDDARFSYLNHGRPPITAGVWQHNPAHRFGVPYRDAATRDRFQGAASVATQRSLRGYGNGETVTPTVNRSPSTAYHPNPVRASAGNRAATPQPQVQRASTLQARYVAPAFHQRPATPMFESFSRGPDVRVQAARGAQSRAAAPVGNTARPSGGNVARASGGNRDSGNNRR